MIAIRLPNSYGTVYRLSGKRRNPWIARKFVCWKIDDKEQKATPVYKTIGYYPKRQDALNALAVYNLDPKDDVKITFADVFSLWSERHFPEISEPTAKSYRNAYAYLAPLHDREMKSIRTVDIEHTVEDADVPRTVVRFIKSLLIQMYRYALAHEVCDKDYSQLVDLKTDHEAQIERKVFTKEEVENLPDDVYGDVMRVALFTGMRPSEVCELQRDEVDFGSGMLRIKGSKTKAGKNRLCPIHPYILSTLQRNCLKSEKFGITGVFVNQHGSQVKYQRYKEQVYKLNHTPHDTRHTFATCAMLSGMDEYAVKLIMGHSVSDLTKRVYTHANEEWLKEQMGKYKIC